MKPFVQEFQLLELQKQKEEWNDPILKCELTEDPYFEEPMGFGIKRLYIMSAKIGLEFYANGAQLERAVKEAKKTLASRLFGEALNITQEIRQAAMDNDEKKILKLCHDLDVYFSGT